MKSAQDTLKGETADAFGAAKAIVTKAQDRGALRALTWGAKVAAILLPSGL